MNCDEIHLLYVDKSKVARRMVVQHLGTIAHVIEAESVAEACRMLSQQTVNFIVVDYELPDGTGLDVVRQAREAASPEQMPILLFTASLNNELAYEAMRTGVNQSLAKPMPMFELLEHVVRHVEVPQTEVVKRELLPMTCFHWVADGLHHSYSPDLNTHVQADTRDQAQSKMQTILEREIRAKKDPEQYPADIDVYKHIIRLMDHPSLEDGSSSGASSAA